MAAEQDVVAIAAKYNAGSLALDAQPLKHSLRSEAASWKAQFARNLHKQGVQNLKVTPSIFVSLTLVNNATDCLMLLH